MMHVDDPLTLSENLCYVMIVNYASILRMGAVTCFSVAMGRLIVCLKSILQKIEDFY